MVLEYLRRRCFAATVVVCACAMVTPEVLADTVPLSEPLEAGYARLAGSVYLDSNNNGYVDIEWAIVGATMMLVDQSNPSNSLTTLTDARGFYSFDMLPGEDGGYYTVLQGTRAYLDGIDSVGHIYDWSNDVWMTADLGEVDYDPATGEDRDQIIDIFLKPGYEAMAYNFGELCYPVELYSKAWLLASTPPMKPIPEPGTLILAAVGGLILLGLAMVRRRNRVAA